MKRRTGVLRTAPLAVAMVLLLAGCALVGTTAKERVLRFEDGLKKNREYLYQDFYEAQTGDYALLQDADVTETWDRWFPPGYPEPGTYSLTVADYSGNPIEAIVAGPEEFGDPKPLQLYLVRVGLDWYLEKLVLDGTTIVD